MRVGGGTRIREEGRKGITFFLLSPSRPRSPFFSSPISFSFTSLGLPLCVLFLSLISTLSPYLALDLPRSSRHPAYIAEGDRIIVRRIPVWFLRGANKTGLRADHVSYGPSCALHARIPMRFEARESTRSCVCACATNIAQYRGPSRWNRI